MDLSLRDYTFLGTTQSLCPECLAVVPAKILERGGRVYFRKRCPAHGEREDFVCSDVSQWDQMEFSLPGKTPHDFGTEPRLGCPLDCGLCSEHEQHTCIGLVEITSSCNLECPVCYAHSGPGGTHLPFDDCCRAIDRLVEVEGHPEVLQLSGGEPTIHPDFAALIDYACARPIQVVMINTNGIRLAHDTALLEHLARYRQVEIYLQFDTFRELTSRRLRGESLVETKLRAIERLGQYNIRTTLVTTLDRENLDELGELVRFGLARPSVTGLSLQPITYSGRFVAPETLEERVTFPDVVKAIVARSPDVFKTDDFMPLACAHPNTHTLTYLYRTPEQAIPLTRFIDARNHLELVANGITFTRPMARQVIEAYLGEQGCCAGGECGGSRDANPLQIISLSGQPCSGSVAADPVRRLADEFFSRALSEDLGPSDVFRITITSFLDAYNFDIRQLMKSCIHHVLPSGHVIPFCAYNVLYRDGHVEPPPLVAREAAPAGAR